MPEHRAIALEYHDVVLADAFEASGFPGNAAASYKLTEQGFAEHLALLTSKHGVIDLRNDATWPARSGIALTFDDGGASAIERIAPMLEARGMRGAFFITTDRIDSAGFLTSAQIVDLHRRGHTIGSHSCSHPIRMTACSAGQLAREWGDSVARLVALLGEPVATASVPGGYYSRAVGEAAAAAGVRLLFTSEPSTRAERIGACRVVGRYTLRRGDRAARVAALVGDASGARRMEWIKWNGKKVAKAVGGRAFLRLRDGVFGDS